MTSNDENVAIKGKYTAMLVCWILGTGSLFPWNSMLTTLDYYSAIFPNYHPSRILTIAVLSFAFGTIIIMTYYEAKMNTRVRNLIGFSLYFIGSASVIVLDLLTSGSGGIGPYIGLCAICATFGVAEGHVQGGMIGDLSLMSPELLQSFLAGLAASGTITSALRLVIKAAFKNTKGGLRKGALLFLALSAFFELVCVFLYAYLFSKLPIVKYYHSKAAAEGSKTVSIDLAATGIQVQDEEDRKRLERLSNKQLLLKNMDYAIDIFLICVLTFTIFPGFLDEDTGSQGLGSWYSLVLIATFNLWDLISRYLPLIKCLRITSRSGLMIATLARFLFIPTFYFTAKHGDQGWMIMLTSFLGLTNGHLSVCVLMAGPKGYKVGGLVRSDPINLKTQRLIFGHVCNTKGPEQNALGNLLQSFLTGGLFAGLAFGWLWLIGKGW